MKDERLNSEFGQLVIHGSTVKKYCGNSNYVRLPGFVYIVGTEAFKDSNVKYITLPSTATKIRDKAFLNCQNLDVIEFSHGLFEIGEYAFKNCSSLAEIIFKGTKIVI